MTAHVPRNDGRCRVDDGELTARWRAELAGTGTRVALADGADPRVVAAAAELAAAGLTPCLVDHPGVKPAARPYRTGILSAVIR